MTQTEFIISATSLYPLVPDGIKAYIQASSKRQLSELAVFDLAISNNQPLRSAGGIYIFFDKNNDCLYVGKATSRSFIERIPAHFDPRQYAWFATFPNRVLSHNLTTDYSSALDFCRHCSILLIQFPSNEDCKKYAANLESYLRTLIEPRFNCNKRPRLIPGDEILGTYLKITEYC